ncbi:hypothetical protein MTO96_016303 [Rhipicephalus appendiculatus]
MAETGGQRGSQETIEEDMSDSGEIGTSEASAEDTAATTGRGNCPQAESTERNMHRPERLHKNRNQSGPSNVAPGTRDVLRRNLSLEYELYSFVRKRLHAQWRLLDS